MNSQKRRSLLADYEQFYNEDFIAHYTSLESARRILDGNTIRLSKRSSAVDCIERVFSEGATVISSCNPKNEQYLRGEEAQTFARYNLQRQKELHQACFCKTGKSKPFHSQKLDDLCFLHPRMWEQYGDKYKGICFILSKETLQKDNPQFFYRDMEYRSLDELGRIRISKGVDGDRLRTLGVDEYSKEQDKNIIHMATYKTKDYENENEFRVMQFSPKEYCYLDISNSIVAVAYFPLYSYEIATGRNKKEIVHFEKKIKNILIKFNCYIRSQKRFLDTCSLKGIKILNIDASSGIIKIESNEEMQKKYEALKQI